MRGLRWAYLIGIHAVLLVLVFKTDFLARAAWRLGLPADHPEMGRSWQHDVAWQLERIDGQAPPGAVLFLGDSITHAFHLGRFGRPAINLGIGYDTAAGVLARLPRYRALATASAVVVLIGINDHLYRDVPAVADYHAQILRRLAAVPRVVAVSVTPVDEQSPRHATDATNAWIAAVNRNLAAACATQANCRYADAWPGLTLGGAGLAPAFHVGDGLHLNPAGYDKLAAAIAPALQP